ncbi:MAG: hypothetical protein FJ291_29640 [Planctomycetes bacterium]|nr:hypothetical protein [Planctomycetota bacterium]
MRLRSVVLLVWLVFATARAGGRAAEPLPWPPTLPDGKAVVADTSPEFLKPAGTLKAGVEIAKTPPTVDFAFFPIQTYEGVPWSCWGDGVVANGKYYTSLGDHGYPGKAPQGNAFVYEYDPEAKSLRCIVDVRKALKPPEGAYCPGKIHGRLDFGSDGWLYFATHRGSGAGTLDKFHYKGDWVLRHNPATGQTEEVVHAPVEKHCIPASVLDPKRLIFYGGTASGGDASEQRICFFAYDVKAKKLLYSGPNGCARYFLLAASTGRVYYEFTDDKGQPTGELMRYDPAAGGAPVKVGTCPGLRAATAETPQGFAYAVSSGQRAEAILWRFDPKTEKVEVLGPAAVASQHYITTIDADPTGRCLYYVPGAHGGSEADGCPIVQFDVTTRRKKIIAFVHPFLKEHTGYTPIGTFGSEVDPRGDKLYVTWHGRRRAAGWDTCALTVIHIPPSERPAPDTR